MGCVEIIGKSQQVERVYFRIKNSRAEQWNKVTIKVCEIITYKDCVCVCVHNYVYGLMYIYMCLWIYMYMYVCMC